MGGLKCSTGAGCGTVFKLDATGKETVLHRFAGGAAGSSPFAGLIRDPEGNLYGTTVYGGDLNCGNPSGCGTVFKLDATGKKTVLHSFAGPPDGSTPYGGLVRDAQGNLYGTTVFGGGYGTVFKLDATGREAVLYSFTSGTDGAYPASGVILDSAGNLLGTTTFGGPSTVGTVFKLDRTGKETMLYSFTGVDGDLPDAGLVPVGENLYGTTQYGGAFHEGNVFKMDKTGKVTGVHDFLGGGQEGSAPAAALIHDAAGNVYGTTLYGGFYNQGTVFKVDATGNATVLHTFTAGADGGSPSGGVIRDAAGNLYGTTQLGGDFYGTVFKLDRTGKETVYRFKGGTNGEYPVGDLILDKAGNLYGATENGGTSGFGTVFKLNTNGKKTVLYSFTGGADGVYPVAGVIADSAGNLYGTTQYGGGVSCFGGGCGTVFKLDKTGKETVLYSFTGGADGAAPVAGLVRDAAGNLYGTAYFGGDSGSLCSGVGGCGVVFKIAP